ncbi:chromosome segregation SMC family protein [Cereibacter sphaeroides]|uniref:chromosome segregation SMC family protein n=1 Tax=Cereibacter sphaeroides TaxID=1063 RepID=UPI003FA40AC8
MRFTRLRLNGFKSFVDPTDLVIHEGLTGVVGPNGCGKSNLLEALRWVMGENRPTAMRGAGMEDVIFAGAATRPARNFAEVALVLDNADRLAPAGFNDADTIEIVRRITRDAGSAYKANTRDVRARDIQMLFADASTGAHSPALVRQGQISELINAKPKARRRILEEAAGISGLYQRRHEAELRLAATEQNLARVEDVLDQLAQQLSTLARQAKQAARYREIGEELRRAEGSLLYRRWREADLARTEALALLRERMTAAGQAEAAARKAAGVRAEAEATLPPKREEEAIAGAVLQRLTVERDALAAEEDRARATIATLVSRVDQLGRDIEREAGLNRDAAETIGRLEWEREALETAHEGHEERLAEAAEAAREAGAALGEREEILSERTEDAARLSARHQSAQRMLVDSRTTLARSEAEAARARETVEAAAEAQERAAETWEEAAAAQEEAQERAEAAEEALVQADEARAEAQSREAEARAQRSAAEGEANALRAEVAALARLVDREAQAGSQLLDRIQVEPGFEAALGAALSDDLRAPEVAADAPSGWAALPDYDETAPLPAGAEPVGPHGGGREVLRRRVGQIGHLGGRRAAGAACGRARGAAPPDRPDRPRRPRGGGGASAAAAAGAAAGEPRRRSLALGRVPRGGRGCALGRGAAAEAAQSAGGAEARSRGGGGPRRGRPAGARGAAGPARAAHPRRSGGPRSPPRRRCARDRSEPRGGPRRSGAFDLGRQARIGAARGEALRGRGDGGPRAAARGGRRGLGAAGSRGGTGGARGSEDGGRGRAHRDDVAPLAP